MDLELLNCVNRIQSQNYLPKKKDTAHSEPLMSDHRRCQIIDQNHKRYTYIHMNSFETIEFALIRLIARQVPVEFDVFEVPGNEKIRLIGKCFWNEQMDRFLVSNWYYNIINDIISDHRLVMSRRIGYAENELLYSPLNGINFFIFSKLEITKQIDRTAVADRTWNV